MNLGAVKSFADVLALLSPRKWVSECAYNAERVKEGALPHICSRPAGDVAVSLCKAYADTVQRFKRFVSEPAVDGAA